MELDMQDLIILDKILLEPNEEMFGNPFLSFYPKETHFKNINFERPPMASPIRKEHE